MTDDQILAVVQAHKEGKKIQERLLNGGTEWFERCCGWNFTKLEYRVAPEPRKPREWLVPIGIKIALNPNGTISFDYQAMVGALGEYIKLREVIE